MVFCEVLNLLNCCLQIYLTHIFLGRKFLTLGTEFMADDFLGNMDSLDIVFPKVTKCHFHKYGPSGSIQKHDGKFKSEFESFHIKNLKSLTYFRLMCDGAQRHQ